MEREDHKHLSLSGIFFEDLQRGSGIFIGEGEYGFIQNEDGRFGEEGEAEDDLLQFSLAYFLDGRIRKVFYSKARRSSSQEA